MAATAARISSQERPEEVISEGLEAEGGSVDVSAWRSRPSIPGATDSIAGTDSSSSDDSGATSATLDGAAGGGMRMGFSST